MAIDNKTLGMIMALGGGGNGGGGGSLIPVPASADIGKVVTAVSDDQGGAEYALVMFPEPSVIDDSVISTALTWSSDKISDELKVKALKYTGIGGATSTIEFPDTPQYIFQIFGNADTGAFARLDGFPYGLGITTTSRILDGTTYSPTQKTAFVTYEGNIMHVRSEDQYRALNVNGYEYTVYYI